MQIKLKNSSSTNQSHAARLATGILMLRRALWLSKLAGKLKFFRESRGAINCVKFQIRLSFVDASMKAMKKIVKRDQFHLESLESKRRKEILISKRTDRHIKLPWRTHNKNN